jgi:hypothetical protein
LKQIREPSEELGLPTAAFGRAFRLAGAESVSAVFVEHISMSHAVGCECGIHKQTVVPINDWVIFAVNQENGSAIVFHLQLQ